MIKIFTIVVNYHSLSQIKKFKIPDVIVIDNDKKNIGFAAAVNKGIKKAIKNGADAVFLVNPDIKISLAQIEKLAEMSGDIMGPVLSFKRYGVQIYDYGGRINFIFGRTTHWENSTGIVDYVSGACMLIKKEVFQKIGLFDQRFFMYFEDVDFCLRAKIAGFKVGVNSNVVIEHKIDEQRLSSNRQKIWFNLRSNFLFVNKWVPWYFKPSAYGYLFLVAVKIGINLLAR